jgi:hypothetical protein
MPTIFDRRTLPNGSPAEGAVACLACGAQEEISALTSAHEADEIRAAFELRHASCNPTRRTLRIADETINGLPVPAASSPVSAHWEVP